MGKSLLKGTIAGGIIIFLWMMISWMVLPWHCATFKQFTNESAVSNVISAGTTEDGIYLLPYFCKEGDTPEEKEQMKQDMSRGPFVFASIKRQGYEVNMTRPMIISLILNFVAALFVTILLLQTRDLTYWGRVGFVTLFGLTVGLLCGIPAWNWWGFSLSYVTIEIIDSIVAWFLAGLAIAAFTRNTLARR